jgi:diguanylate cyclase (GGDEF)-like protein
MVARYGGEEFVVLMPGTATEAALMRIETLRQEIADSPIELGGGEALRLSFSAGIAGTSEDFEPVTPKALLTRADKRLLAAKRAGRGRCIGASVAAVPGESS